MSVVKQLYLQTKALVNLLEKPFPTDDEAREKYIEEIVNRLEERERFIQQIDRHSFSETERKLGDELYKLNKKLTKKITKRKSDIQVNIAQLKTKKKTGLKYENPYGERTVDGIFFDERIL